MLKVNELRLSNLIFHNGELMPVVQIEKRYKTIYRLNDMDIDERIICDTFQPIPLTPEWLERCGFTAVTNCRYNGPVGMVITRETQYDDSWKILGTNSVLFNTVHQLQNLYFALTGEELAITHPVT